MNRIAKVKDWLPHLVKLGVGAVYFCPVFDSDRHGYDTRDFKTIDPRLGSNQDFKEICQALHSARHPGWCWTACLTTWAGAFWAFQDVLKNREASPYKDWFYVNFQGNSGYNDGLWYEGWEGHYELVKLNLQNPAVVDYLLDCVAFWMDEFDIDGLRLDVAYSLDEDLPAAAPRLLQGPGARLLPPGEMIHGDYKRIMNPEMLDSVTNYECYKGLYSAFNSLNLFEIAPLPGPAVWPRALDPLQGGAPVQLRRQPRP